MINIEINDRVLYSFPRIRPNPTCSHASVHEGLCHIDHAVLAVTCVLHFSIAHWLVLLVNSHQKGLAGSGNASSASSSSKGAERDLAVVCCIGSDEHVFGIADSEPALLASFSISACGLHKCGMLVTWDLFG